MPEVDYKNTLDINRNLKIKSIIKVGKMVEKV